MAQTDTLPTPHQASFSTVSAALLWCFNVQLLLLKEDWPQELLESEEGKEIRDDDGNLIYRGLRLRMGIHWGSPVCEPDPITGRMDYFGPMVNRASRIESAARGGQIFVSKDVVQELEATMGALDATNQARSEDEEVGYSGSRDVILLRRMGFGIKEIGFRRLKGLESPELLFSVYPSAIAGRIEYDPSLADPEAPARVFEPTVQLLDAAQVRQVGLLCLRIEALSAGHIFDALVADGALVSPDLRSQHVSQAASAVPELLAVGVRDDAPDEELAIALVQLTVRLANAVGKMTLDSVIRALPPSMLAPSPGPGAGTETGPGTGDAGGAAGAAPASGAKDALGVPLAQLHQLVARLQRMV